MSGWKTLRVVIRGPNLREPAMVGSAPSHSYGDVNNSNRQRIWMNHRLPARRNKVFWAVSPLYGWDSEDQVSARLLRLRAFGWRSETDHLCPPRFRKATPSLTVGLPRPHPFCSRWYWFHSLPNSYADSLYLSESLAPLPCPLTPSPTHYIRGRRGRKQRRSCVACSESCLAE